MVVHHWRFDDGILKGHNGLRSDWLWAFLNFIAAAPSFGSIMAQVVCGIPGAGAAFETRAREVERRCRDENLGCNQHPQTHVLAVKRDVRGFKQVAITASEQEMGLAMGFLEQLNALIILRDLAKHQNPKVADHAKLLLEQRPSVRIPPPQLLAQ